MRLRNAKNFWSDCTHTQSQCQEGRCKYNPIAHSKVCNTNDCSWQCWPKKIHSCGFTDSKCFVNQNHCSQYDNIASAETAFTIMFAVVIVWLSWAGKGKWVSRSGMSRFSCASTIKRRLIVQTTRKQVFLRVFRQLETLENFHQGIFYWHPYSKTNGKVLNIFYSVLKTTMTSNWHFLVAITIRYSFLMGSNNA